MQLQSISSTYPNTISITRIREDADSLTNLLKKYKQVQVLRGQGVWFNAVRPDSPEEIKKQKLRAAFRIMENAKRIPATKNGRSLTKFLVAERDKMRSGKYEL